ncbi:MAG: sensor histidine kinase [Intestinibacillus sp.]
MIQKLRRKFILINMGLVALVLLCVFSVFCFVNVQNLQNQSYDALRHALSRDMGAAPPKFQIGGPGVPRDDRVFNNVPVFTVRLDESRNVIGMQADDVEVSDETAAEAVKAALAAGTPRGVVRALGLRFLIEKTPGGTQIGFADMSGERSSFLALLLTALAVGAGALAAFFGISLFLSGWALCPVAKAWEGQRQFVADASHELKTPLTVILANTGILLSHPDDTIRAQQKWLEHTRTEGERMKKLVDDLLFLAKSDAPAPPERCAPFDLSDAAWGCLLPLEPIAFERGVNLISDVPPKLILHGDEGRIKQLMVILLDNACKYAGRGGEVRFAVSAENGWARLEVRNTGDPIPPEQLPRLFERFYRVDGARTREQGGTGLGLAIAKTIVEQHRGRIAVQSTAACTTFTVHLPLK